MVINKHGTEVIQDAYWTMHCPPNIARRSDETWIMKIIHVQDNGLVPVFYVNWKRKGTGYSSSRNLSDFGSSFFDNLKPATEEEIKYFDKRMER